MEYIEILKKYWGYEGFRGVQLDIIKSIGEGHDTLGLMPTGGGKSITFQVPAIAMDGTCIVVTPLISLMKDQVDRLRKLGIPSYSLHSGLTHKEIVKILDNCIYGKIKFLYVSPERLESTFFLRKLENINLSFITIDEAHCISQWGHDFRPSYLRIKKLRTLFPEKPVLALTATATEEVVEDIKKALNFKNSNTYKMSFRRKNISYVIRHTEERILEIIHILNSVEGSTIIYAGSRKKTKELAIELREQGFSATYYHADLDIAVKTQHQLEWQKGEKRIIVATNAFGMGIDKPDVRLVIHYDIPSSIEAYFQEAGRAGRDGEKAYAVLLVLKASKGKLLEKIGKKYPDKETIKNIYSHIAYYYQIGVGMGKGMSYYFPIEKFCSIYHFSLTQVDAAINILDNAGYMSYDKSEEDCARVKFILKREDLYKLRELHNTEEMLINCIMRRYTGVFTDPAYIEEDCLAHDMQTNRDKIIVLLKTLQRKRIILYIPPRKDPKLTFLVNRVDEKDIVLKPQVYDERKRVMIQQTEAMLEYMSNSDTCRQVMLTRYFSDTDSSPCRICDVCIKLRKIERTPNDDEKRHCKTEILSLLSDKKGHLYEEVQKIPFKKDVIAAAVHELLRDEIIFSDSIRISLTGDNKK